MRDPLGANTSSAYRSIIVNKKFIVGTRGSPLALAQTNLVIAALKEKSPDTLFETRIITTAGDMPNKPREFSGKDSFTGKIDLALRTGEVDIAVHSLKDVPAEQDGIEIAAFPKRGSPFDVLVSREGRPRLFELPTGANVGTSSVRRAIQLKAVRRDLNLVETTGNIHTRLAKLRSKESKLDALVLAEAGLHRLGMFEAGEVLPTSVMLPAPGQGCLAVAVRNDDRIAKILVSEIDDSDTRLVASCERSFSKALGGGCKVPVAALAKVVNENGRKISLEGLVQKRSSTGESIVRGIKTGELEDAEQVGRKLATELGAIP
ncbi:MAG: hydroxymethylbilane synthase [Nitrososphaerota archaeon]|nr:hydroxymethylbilane synthase [Nitrososphaerota archaeon]